MIDKEKWAIGRKIKFSQSGLTGTGKIIFHRESGILLILLDEEFANAGWRITNECAGYENQRGWWVGVQNAKLLQTRLGNSL